ncbi:MAG TPA: amidohydrolase family protein [Thermoanaerobaculia bacterium]|nr:amidohydrolase family protein [Thermoanaerobaculia bacterium]
MRGTSWRGQRFSLWFLVTILSLQAGCTAGPGRVKTAPAAAAPAGDAQADAMVLPGHGAETRSFVCRQLAPLASGVCSVSGSGTALLLRGNVLAPDQVLMGGEVLVSPEGTILAVGCDTSQVAAGLGLTEVTCPRGVISPGLINSHDHLWFDQNPPGIWGTERYDHRNQWRKGLDGHTQIPAPRAPTDLQVAWAELRQLLSGTTSIAGSGGYRGLLRNLDVAQLQEGLGVAGAVQYNTFPLGDTAGQRVPSGCDYPHIDGPEVLQNLAYLPHLAEGVAVTARNEFLCLSGQQAGGSDLLAANSNFIHMLGTLAPDADALAKAGASVVWSPRSNIALYGNTVSPRLLATLGVNVSLSTDWTPSGSHNLLRELRCAADFNAVYLDGFFSTRDLWHMVTGAPADAFRLPHRIGRLAAGLVADIAVYDGAAVADPYGAVLGADAGKVALVLRGGAPLYGDTSLLASLPGADTGCEPLPQSVCGTPKTVCLEKDTGLDYAQLAQANATFYGLVFCGPPPGEPTCVPSRPGEYSGRPGPGDGDGDGIADGADNCPRVFNPIRPLDNGAQADWNGDGIGDVCDPCPLGGCAAP